MAKVKRDADNAKLVKTRNVKPKEKGKKKAITDKSKRVESVEPSPNATKGPGSAIKKRKVEKVLTKALGVSVLKTQKVLNDRVFDPKIHAKLRIRNVVDVVVIQDWLHLFKWPVPTLQNREVSILLLFIILRRQAKLDDFYSRSQDLFE